MSKDVTVFVEPVHQRTPLDPVGTVSDADLVVERLGDVAALHHVRAEWDALLVKSFSPSIFHTWEWVTSWCESFGRDATLMLVTIRLRSGQLVGIVPCSISTTRLGIRRLSLLGLGTYLTESVDVVMDPRYADAATQALLRFWDARSAEWDLLSLQALPHTSPLVRHLIMGDAEQRGYWMHSSATQAMGRPLPATWDAFYRTLRKSMKQNVNNYVNRLRRDGHDAEFVIADDMQEIDATIEMFLHLHRQRAASDLQPRHKDYFAATDTSEFVHLLARRLMARGWLWPCFLTIDGKAVAAQLCLVYRGRMYRYYSGFDPAWASYGVMTVLTRRGIEHAITQGCHELDLLLGADQEKARWGTEPRPYYYAVFSNRRLRSRASFLVHRLYRTARARIDERRGGKKQVSNPTGGADVGGVRGWLARSRPSALKETWRTASPASYDALHRLYWGVRRGPETALDLVGEMAAGMRTRGNVMRDGIGITAETGNEYIPSAWRPVRAALRAIRIAPDDAFLDFGSGKGRVLCLAAEYPFKRVVGVDISAEMNRMARANVERMRARFRCQDIAVFQSEATAFEIPDDVTIVYFFNPFEGATFRRVVENVKRSLERRPRTLRILYLNPTMHETVVQAGFQEVDRIRMPVSHDLVIYANVPSFAGTSELPSLLQPSGCAAARPSGGARLALLGGRAIAGLWSLVPSELLKTALVSHLGSRFLVSVVAVIFDAEGRVLLLRHTYDREHPWGLPSGRLEATERPEEALVRELAEETGLTIRVDRVVGIEREQPLPVLRVAYLCEVIGGAPRPSVEVSEARYFSPTDLPPSVRPVQRSIVEQALRLRGER